MSRLAAGAARLLRSPVARLAEGVRAAQDRRRRAWVLDLVRRCDFDAADLARNRAQLAEAARLRSPVASVNWYLPAFENAFYGGVHTVLRFADGWRARHGIESRFLIHDETRLKADAIRRRIAAAFPMLAASEVRILTPSADVPAADAGIATLWTGAYALLKEPGAARKLYFLQDDERLFYPAGTQSALAGATWRFGFPAIVNTPGLAAVYARETGVPCYAFVPAVDARVYHPPDEARPRRPFRVFFYARPRIDRNAFELGLEALRRFARTRAGEVEIIAAGAGVPRSIVAASPEITFRGLLPYAETGALYRTCNAGISLMLTRHPSYLPFELMACGAVPLVNANPDNSWLLRDGETAVVSEPTASALCQGLERLMDDPPLRARLAAAGVQTVSRYAWDDQIDAAAEFLSHPWQASRSPGDGHRRPGAQP